MIAVLTATAIGFGCAATAHATAADLTLATPSDGSATNVTTPTFSGTASTDPTDSTSVIVKVYSGLDHNGTLIQSPSATRPLLGSSWSVDAAALADGTYTAEATQQLSGGGTATTAPHTFTVDTQPPAVTLDTPAQDSSTTDTTPGLKGAIGIAKGDLGLTVKIYNGSGTGGTV
ncbi:MAG TPA: Ig-like domain-containing protein, partial [Solirubrobacteraceae bacterium]|nr:Ig-like domain-containing protein [Solirubrobacteraceae bacterium]